MIITIDGRVATGKSTVAKQLAAAIGYVYFDTGAMYRAFTYSLIKHNVNPDDDAAVKQVLEIFDFRIKVFRGDRKYFIEHEDVTNVIRSQEVTSLVSKISAKPYVREKMTALQREHGKGLNAVFEGRDAGTVVFPDAPLKIFLTGRPEVRAKRRYDEIKAKYPEQAKGLTLEQVLAEINARDEYDSTREVAPLKQPEDACVVDTSDLTVDEVILRILEYKDTLKTRQKGV